MSVLVCYGFVHMAFFGLLVGLSAEELNTWRKWVFIWCLAAGWPVVIAWKLLCNSERTK